MLRGRFIVSTAAVRFPPIVCALALLAAAPAHAQDEPERVSVTAILHGPEALRARVEEAVLAPELPVAVRTAPLPGGGEGEAENPALNEALASARSSYVSAEFGACLAGLEDDEALHARLATGERDLVARALFWRVACRVGGDDAAGGEREAARFATFGLDVPPDTEARTPEVEAVLAAAIRASGEAPRASVAIRASRTAAVSVDGRRPGCETPCTVDLPPGDHVVRVTADGYVPAWRLVRVEGDGAEVDFELDDAPPDLAARQWAERWIGHPRLDSASSVELLARATRARRLVLLQATAEDGGPRLRGVLTVDGRVVARGARSGDDVEGETRGLLRDLLVEGGAIEPAPEIWESPWLWIAVGVVVAAAVAIPLAVFFEVDTRTSVGF